MCLGTDSASLFIHLFISLFLWKDQVWKENKGILITTIQKLQPLTWNVVMEKKKYITPGTSKYTTKVQNKSEASKGPYYGPIPYFRAHGQNFHIISLGYESPCLLNTGSHEKWLSNIPYLYKVLLAVRPQRRSKHSAELLHILPMYFTPVNTQVSRM